MDSRLIPANGRVAALHLRGQIEAERFVEGRWFRVRSPIADLQSAKGDRLRQLLMGDRFLVLETRGGWSFGQSEKDGYSGYLAADTLGPDLVVTHWVSAPATHSYSGPDMKGEIRSTLGLGSKLKVVDETPKFVFAENVGYVPVQHVSRLEDRLADIASIAEQFEGAPYLWGGNHWSGIDCSGLVQGAVLACGFVCPADSDQQSKSLGSEIPLDTPAQRGDLLFWKGHVGIACSETEIVHANAFHMAVRKEAINVVTTRISVSGDGPMLRKRRLPRSAG